MTCKYCKAFDHVIEEFSVLIAEIKENKNPQPTQNIQMMTVELRTDEPCTNIVTRSGPAIGNDKEYGKKVVEHTWVRKTTNKALMFDIHKEK